MDLRHARNLRNYTQVQLSEKVGISNTAFSQIESGMRFPRAATRESIEKALGMKVDWLDTRFCGMNTRNLNRNSDNSSSEDLIMRQIYTFIKSGQLKQRGLRFKFLHQFLAEFENALKEEQEAQMKKIKRKRGKNENIKK